ncbi:MAG: GNAT family N-acetyltransferase [bacterium]
MIAGIRFEPATEAGILEARALFEEAFGGPATPEQWLRKYFRNPAGSVAAFEARDGDRLVGFVALHPGEFSVRGERVTVYQAGDVMTDPAYRRRGILKKLRGLAGDWLREHGAPFTISFPTAAVLAANKKLGYVVVGRLRRWVKPLAPLGPVWRRLPAAAFARLASAVEPTIGARPPERLASYDERIDLAWERARGRWKFVGVRGAKFFEWRYPDDGLTAAWISPEGGADGYVVAERAARGLWIRDLVAAEDAPATVGTLLAVVTAHAREVGAEHVTFPHFGSCYRTSLLRNGFLPLPGGAPFLLYEFTRPSPERRRAANWLVTDADRDVACL